MTDDTPRFTTPDRTGTQSADLVAVPDDPDDPAEITLHPDDAPEERLATAWITADVEAVVDVAQWR